MRAPAFRAQFEGEFVVDNFAGGGGASTGIETALGRPVDMAINHDPIAIAMHRANHPETKLQLAYALTVHKYQGSEVPWAVVFCHSTHSRMLERTLLYTAVTRAKRGVVLVGDRTGLQRAVKNASSKKRNTGLADRLRAGLREVSGVNAVSEAGDQGGEGAAERSGG